MIPEYAWVLSGNTFPWKHVISDHGFLWSRRDKVWIMRIDAKDLEKKDRIRQWLKTLRGVTVTQEKAEKFPELNREPVYLAAWAQ